jgi:hypothetical protein
MEIIGEFKMKNFLHEVTPPEQAKGMGLVYGGFASWLDPKTRKAVAQTVEGTLVKIDHEGDGASTDLGKVNIFRLDIQVIRDGNERSEKYTDRYNKILKFILKLGDGPLIILTPLNTQHEVAEYFQKNGITSGLKLSPINDADPNEIHSYVETKIKEGYTSIQYFDTNNINIKTVESLEAPYNKLDLTINTHKLKGMDEKEQ